MSEHSSALAGWTPEQVENGRKWVKAWQMAGPLLEQIRRRELAALDAYAAIALLCGDADYTVPPRAPKSTSGLVDQQRFFKRAR